MKKRLKINGLIMFFFFVIIVAFPAIFFRRDTLKYGFFNPGQVLEILGIAFILLGQVIRASSRGFKSEHSRNGHALIQGGPYALVRNPMYLGIFLIGLGIVLVLFKWWAICIFLLVFIVRYLALIFTEEKKLKRLFPKEYPEYQKKVPRIFPPAAALLKRDISEYLPLRPQWIKHELGSILAVLLATLLVESWEDIKQRGLASYSSEAALYLIVVMLFVCMAIYLSKRTARLKKDGAG